MENHSNRVRPNAIDSTTGGDLAEQALQSRHDALTRSDTKTSSEDSAAPAIATGSWMEDVKAQIRENPLTSVGIVAALGYLWGATR